jgi:hypothetical protein
MNVYRICNNESSLSPVIDINGNHFMGAFIQIFEQIPSNDSITNVIKFKVITAACFLENGDPGLCQPLISGYYFHDNSIKQ